jgi:hypothetical protein
MTRVTGAAVSCCAADNGSDRLIAPAGGQGAEFPQPIERRLKRMGQEIRDAVPERRERRGGRGLGRRGGGARRAAAPSAHANIAAREPQSAEGGGGGGGGGGGVTQPRQRKQLLLGSSCLTGRKEDKPAGWGEDGEGGECGELALALALSASEAGEGSACMRRRREVARRLAEVCLWRDAAQGELQV